jgi:phage gpG-like protein
VSDESIRLIVTGEESTRKGLERRQAALGRARTKALRLSAEIVLSRATENISGRILRVQTGTLRRRLSYIILADQGVAKVGSPTVYAPVHEYGATIQHPGGTAYYFDERRDRAVWLSNKAAAGHAFPRTRPHPIPIPARPWLRPALKDSRAQIEAVFNREAAAALKSGEVAP